MGLDIIAGRCTVTISGTNYSIQGDVVIMPSKIRRTPVIGVNGPDGIKERGVAPGFRMTVFNTPETEWKRFENIVNETIIITSGTKTYTITNATCRGQFGISTDQGTIGLSFFGTNVD